MSAQIGFPLYSLQAIDPKTGQWNREWWLFLQFLWNRSGGSTGPSATDLDAYLQFDIREADAAELSKQVQQLALQIEQAVELYARFAELAKVQADAATETALLQTVQVAELKKSISDLQIQQAFTV
jgi:hypothetical protein